MKNKKHKEPIEFKKIEAAMQGDVDSINYIIAYFQPFIHARCTREFTDEFGQKQYAVDEYMKRRMETKLITKILDFKIQL